MLFGTHLILGRRCLSQMRCISNDSLREVMRHIPQPVVVITSAMAHPRYGVVKRGVTCSSIASISMEPPTVSVSIYDGNLINKIIESSGVFCVNLLCHSQVKLGMHFSRSLNHDYSYNQLEDVPHTSGLKSIPVLDGCKGSMQCEVDNLHYSGDHYVWYGVVNEASVNPDPSSNPMLYFNRSFRSIGDEIFMQAFETATIPFEEWTHEAHLRMAWNYITIHGKELATPLIQSGIRKYNKANAEKITHGYNETVTQFFIHCISKGIYQMPDGHTFEDFLLCNKHLTNSGYLFKFYSKNRLDSGEAKSNLVESDIQPWS